MARRNTPVYQTDKAIQAEPYLGSYSALAEQFLKKRNTPVYSVGQGIAEAGGDILESYLLKKAMQRDAAKEQADYSDIAKAIATASDAGLTRDAETGALYSPQDFGGLSVNAPGMSPQARYQEAMQALAGTNPKMAVQNAPAIMQMAQQAQPPKTTYQNVPGVGMVAVPPDGAAPSVAIPIEQKSGLKSPEEEAQAIRIAQGSRTDQEPLVQVPDPADPSRSIYVQRSQAVGRPAFQTPRDRAFKLQTYWGEDGSSRQLDSNDPEDQKIIKELGLVTASPSDGNRTAKGFLDRMVSAEKEIDDILAKNPKVMQGLKDNLLSGTPIIGNALVSPEYRQVLQKTKDWIRAKLRKESGAVIGDQEALDELKTYFSTFGDDPGTLEGKKSSRLEARRQLATDAGILGRPYTREFAAPASPQASAPAVTKWTRDAQGRPVPAK